MNKILYAGFALLLCASCSNDNDRDITSLPEAKISLQVKASGANKKSPLKAVTKAGTDANELTGEAYINNITAFVFNEDGSQLLSTTPYYQETTPADGELTIPNIPARAAKARIILVGNANGTLSNITSYAGLEAALCQLSSQVQDNLTMSSLVIETEESLVAGDENYIGYESMGKNNINGISTPLELTRLAARLDVVNVKTSFTRPELLGRTVKIESITVANQKTASRFFSHDYWGPVFVEGNLSTSTATAMNLEVDNNTSLAEIAYRSYVMENDGSEEPTELLIKATLSAKVPYLAETRVFGAVINENGLSAYGHNNIKRNYVYKIALSFNDESFESVEPDPNPTPDPDPDPDPTPDPDPVYGLVNLAISVAEWNTKVIDVPDIDN